ncbi:hypothetical protein INT45_006869 [Circinella minor]|uniref:Heterokaryon incompatibility domain-containing protein n=1 Tax=Circinella minor TaxID=1195481 RepID=A0A8H7VDR2_9FUNG|nr:hypothetical protein INT45_006869 [Circinella minor]
MTYFIYEKKQYYETPPKFLENDYSYYTPDESRPKRIAYGLLKPKFMPSYLVDTYDMRLVKGSDVDQGYCTLSYSWNQSGEILIDKTTGKSSRLDQGKHEIIFPESALQENSEYQEQTLDEVKYVKFEGLIQEICRDFGIRYIWYDQMCIDQEDEKKKHAEIHQMHKIYSNAYCTVALIPELMIDNVESPGSTVYEFDHYSMFQEAQWMKRMWTLEEALVSSQILFVGRNVHLWSYNLKEYTYPIFHMQSNYAIPAVLHYAQTRTSTKEHDHIFALANIFPDIIKQITVNYNQDVQDLMLQFYGLLAKHDLRILCFGRIAYDNDMHKPSPGHSMEGDDMDKVKCEQGLVQKFDLPSWTGVHGKYYKYGYRKTIFKNYTVSGKVLKITCWGITNDQRPTNILDFQRIGDMIPPFTQQEEGRTTVLQVRLQGPTKENFIYVDCKINRELDPIKYKDVVANVRDLSHFFPIKKTDLQWVSYDDMIFSSTFSFNNLTEPLQDSAQYVLLSGVNLMLNIGGIGTERLPVIKKDGDHYKAIGTCGITEYDYFLEDPILEEQTFEIH